jgi:hypothetical protein
VSASAERARGYRVDRYVNGGEIVEIVFPAHAYIGECLGVCSVPTGVSVEEALRLLRENRSNPWRPVEAVRSLNLPSSRAMREPSQTPDVGSIPIARSISPGSGPETWVTECTGYIGNTFGPNGFSSGSNTRVSRSKYPRS